MKEKGFLFKANYARVLNLKDMRKSKCGMHTDLPVGEVLLCQVNWAWLPHWIQLEFLVSATPSWSLFLFPTKVSGQHIPEGTHKETRVVVI